MLIVMKKKPAKPIAAKAILHGSLSLLKTSMKITKDNRVITERVNGIFMRPFFSPIFLTHVKREYVFPSNCRQQAILEIVCLRVKKKVQNAHSRIVTIFYI